MRRTVRPGDAPRQAAPGSPAKVGPGPLRTTPYQGLGPFTEQDAPFFFGREAERSILVANLMAARLTLVYGASGVGKSSILQAGVIRHLRDQERDHTEAADTPRLLVVYVNEWAGDPVARLLERIGEEMARMLEDPAVAAETPPSGLAGTLAAWTGRWNLDLLIILDQFEEYFLYHRDEDGPGTFGTEFSQAVNRSDLPLTFLIGIREDALARLDRFKGPRAQPLRELRPHQAPARQPGRGRRRRTAQAAQRAVARRGTLDGRPRPGPAGARRVRVGGVVLSVVGRGMAARAADRPPTDPAIETPYLQMVLTRLWAEERRQGSRRLRLQTLEALGDPHRIVRTHLDEALERLPGAQQEVAAGIFHYLVTPGGAKIGHTATDLATYTGLPETGSGWCWTGCPLPTPASCARSRLRPAPRRNPTTRSSTTCSPRRSSVGGRCSTAGGRPRRPQPASSRSGPSSGGGAPGSGARCWSGS
jgi:conflict system STAND superfamily ATPase